MYYPLSNITPNLYTSGNEFAIASTGKDYVGYYFSTYDGKYFTNKTPSNSSVELVKSNSGGANSLASLKYVKAAPPQSTPDHYIPTPTEEEYQVGYMMRYFSKRVNGDSSTIRELSRESFNSIQKDPLYTSVMLKWEISGYLKGITLSAGNVVPGVVSANSSAIRLAERVLPGLSRYLVNISQFYK